MSEEQEEQEDQEQEPLPEQMFDQEQQELQTQHLLIPMDEYLASGGHIGTQQ